MTNSNYAAIAKRIATSKSQVSAMLARHAKGGNVSSEDYAQLVEVESHLRDAFMALLPLINSKASAKA